MNLAARLVMCAIHLYFILAAHYSLEYLPFNHGTARPARCKNGRIVACRRPRKERFTRIKQMRFSAKCMPLLPRRGRDRTIPD